MKKEKLLDRYQKIKQEFNSVQHFSVFRMSKFLFFRKENKSFYELFYGMGL